ncbi:glycosyl transferase family 2 [Pirellula staleyi DSM 6068]|uniref:Glycosyl transferase family 2 n=1 Tax=Pirellula staleyi (strain ATCC 27377 / DSM 6068 / ICPB 4128) TaxID=530564 RepID=D2R733_PIRSD|nr:glycosyltransferase [Pirellula staleyi]ADB19236.1 glycosyl transferase family 2 [Pirellula staleyi DSM 6068]
MDVSVILCTWNRAAILHRTLQSLRSLVVPPRISWELLVVNNHSSDNTDDVLARHHGALPIRRLYEARAGKSNAMNTGIAAASGDLLLMTDDDVLVDPEWLVSYVAISRSFPDASFFGGPIKPVFGSVVPSWITAGWEHVRSVFGELDYGPQPIAIGRKTLPYGANFAVRLPVMRQFPINVHLGRSKHSRIAGEESELFARLLAAGHQGIYQPTALIGHGIEADQLTERYVRRYFDGIGRTQVLLEGLAHADRPFKSSKLAKYWFRAMKHEFAYRRRCILGSAEKRTKHLVRSARAWGAFSQYRLMLDEQRREPNGAMLTTSAAVPRRMAATHPLS